jgi:hypothetical protein
MALVHHALVLFSARKAGKDPLTFNLYRVLGDDNVNADEDVSLSYIRQCDALCVPTSLAKTISGLLISFASQAVVDGVNVSNLSLQEELNIDDFSQRLEMALRATRRGWLTWSKGPVAGFLRHLLPRKDYVYSVREFAQGRLGTVAQSALVQALSVSGKVLLSLLPTQPGAELLLLAFANRFEALSQNANLYASKLFPRHKEISILLALITLRRVSERLDSHIEKYDETWIRYRDLVVGFQTEPDKTIQRWLEMSDEEWATDGKDVCWVPQILASVFMEHFAHATEIKEVRNPNKGSPKKYLEYEIPRDRASRFEKVKLALREAIDTLINRQESPAFFSESPWDLVDGVFAEFARLPRLPDLDSWKNLVRKVKTLPAMARLKRT